MKKCIFFILILFICSTYVFAGKMIIKNNVLIKYKPNKIDKYACPVEEKINSLVIPEGVTSIGANAFTNFSGQIKYISLPSTLKFIDPIGMFQQWRGERGGGQESIHLKGIKVSPNNKNYASIDGVLFNKDKTKLIYYPDCRGVSTYKIPSSVTFIQKNAFPENSNYFLDYNGEWNEYGNQLTELIITRNVKRLATYSINCLNLKYLTIENPNIIIEKFAFGGSFNYSQTKLYAPEAVINKYFEPIEPYYEDSNDGVYKSYAVDEAYSWDY